MKALVVYDSFFGNTEEVARAIGDVLRGLGEAEIVRASEARADQLNGLDLLIVGSPTRAFSSSPNTKAFLSRIPANALDGVEVAAFDTRINPEDTNSGVLKVMVRIFGYAAKPIARKLVQKGGHLTAPPEGFDVAGSEGPLKEGELERAEGWARGLVPGVTEPT